MSEPQREFWKLTEHENGVHVLAFSNPPHHTMPVSGMAELHKLVDSLADKDGLTVLILTGASDGYFVAHADLGDLLKIGRREDVGADPASWYMATIGLAGFPAPTVAAINGRAAGGGLELALCADIRFASRSALLGQPEVRVGIIPGAGGSQRLAKLIGKSRAAELIFEGRLVEAAEALSLGIVNRVYEDEDLMPATLEFAAGLASLPQDAIRAAKTAISSSDVPVAEGLALESRLFSKLLPGEEAQRLLTEAGESLFDQ